MFAMVGVVFCAEVTVVSGVLFVLAVVVSTIPVLVRKNFVLAAVLVSSVGGELHSVALSVVVRIVVAVLC